MNARGKRGAIVGPAEARVRNAARADPFINQSPRGSMTEPGFQPDQRARRGRSEIRLVFLLVLVVLLVGAAYALMFGSPNSENRERDDPNAGPTLTFSEGDARSR